MSNVRKQKINKNEQSFWKKSKKKKTNLKSMLNLILSIFLKVNGSDVMWQTSLNRSIQSQHCQSTKEFQLMCFFLFSIKRCIIIIVRPPTIQSGNNCNFKIDLTLKSSDKSAEFTFHSSNIFFCMLCHRARLVAVFCVLAHKNNVTVIIFHFEAEMKMSWFSCKHLFFFFWMN